MYEVCIYFLYIDRRRILDGINKDVQKSINKLDDRVKKSFEDLLIRLNNV